ncbi:MAG: hypothetical protein ACRD19_11560 [Terriglobia bacterium]
MSKNTNCLEGIRCPVCGYEDTFRIAASVIVTVTDDGTDDEGGHYEWDDTNYCECGKCAHAGTIGTFSEQQTQPPSS